MAEESGKKKKKHLHEIRSQQADDGAIVHHHTYKASREDHHTEPERQNVATSANPEEAGQHTADMFAQNENAVQPAQGEPDGDEGAAQGGEPPQAQMA